MSYEAESILADKIHRPTEFSPMYTCDFNSFTVFCQLKVLIIFLQAGHYFGKNIGFNLGNYLGSV